MSYQYHSLSGNVCALEQHSEYRAPFSSTTLESDGLTTYAASSETAWCFQTQVWFSCSRTVGALSMKTADRRLVVREDASSEDDVNWHGKRVGTIGGVLCCDRGAVHDICRRTRLSADVLSDVSHLSKQGCCQYPNAQTSGKTHACPKLARIQRRGRRATHTQYVHNYNSPYRAAACVTLARRETRASRLGERS